MSEDQKPIDGEEKPLCEKCGTILEEVNGKLICPKCAMEIDYFGENSNEDKKD